MGKIVLRKLRYREGEKLKGRKLYCIPETDTEGVRELDGMVGFSTLRGSTLQGN